MLTAPVGRYIPFVKSTKSAPKDIPQRKGRSRSVSYSYPPEDDPDLPPPSQTRMRRHSEPLPEVAALVRRRYEAAHGIPVTAYGMDLGLDDASLLYARRYLLNDGGDLSKNNPGKESPRSGFMKKLMNLLHRNSEEKEAKFQKELRRHCLEALEKEPSKSCLRMRTPSMSVSDPTLIKESPHSSPEPIRRKKTVSFCDDAINNLSDTTISAAAVHKH